MATRILLPIFLLSLLLSMAVGMQPSETSQSKTGQPQLKELKVSKPSRKIKSEGGLTELFNPNENQFQFVGAVVLKNTLKPKTLSLPNFHPAPRLVYIERGRGLLGITYPGCPETYHSETSIGGREGNEKKEKESGSIKRDQHQKVHRVKQGDIVLLQSGVTHFCLNDGDEDLVAVSFNDLNNENNQLGRRFRAFYLAGGVPKGQQESEEDHEPFQNIFRELNAELLAEVYDTSVEIIKQMQDEENDRGLIVKVQEGIKVISPSEQEEDEEGKEDIVPKKQNGLEEASCTAKINQNIDKPKDAYIYAKKAGRLNVVNEHTLPLLRLADMSAEKLNLLPNALLAPHYTINSHTIGYVTEGEAHIQIVDYNGQIALNETLRQGEVFVIPQLFVSILKAGKRGFEGVFFKTSSRPMVSSLAGYGSILRGLPLQVITNSYQISPNDAQEVKQNRKYEHLLLSPSPRRSSS
ncbi:11S globulin seed storage protein 2-like [Malania oleifera]|uniref:11S globulin seed storage protein 2-like n=1 Tax=Malania oleifera TaxID=397392 RepID=UPI0025AE7982|nr:11S globulin seed storage protein 2-like [Malania oleifera]